MICEIIRILDAEVDKIDYLVSKFGDNWKFVDYGARINFFEGAKTGVLKCSSSFNHYMARHETVNREYNPNECPRCLEAEDWEYVLLCVLNEEMHEEFIF